VSLLQVATPPESKLIAPVEQQPSLVVTTTPPAVPQDLPAGAQAVAPSPPAHPDATQPQPSAAAGDGPSSAAPLEQVDPPVRLKTVQAVYPQIARAAQLEGDVVVQAAVDPNGRVTDVRILRTAHRLLNDAAIVAVRQYEYRPGRRNSTPATFFVLETVAFRLK
jgi:TonB family protein